MKKVLLTCAAAGLLIAGGTASAAAMAPCPPMFHPWYVGVGLNYYTGMKEEVGAVPAVFGVAKLKDSKLGWNIFAGYNVNPKFGTELGFVDFGKNTYNWTAMGITALRDTTNGWLVYFDGMYYVPVYKCFKVFAKGGVDYLNMNYKMYGLPAWAQVGSGKLYTFGLNVGVGAQVDYNQFGARLTYTDYQAVTFGQKWAPAIAGGATTMPFSIPNLLNLDIMYHFG
jgi:hypothetical protein